MLDYLLCFNMYIAAGLLYIRSYREYVDHTFPYKLVLCWFILPFHLFLSDIKNGKNVIRIRDKEGRALRLLITKDTVIIDEREKKEDSPNEQ